MALLASRACTVASSRIQWGGPDMEALGEEMEGWAIGVLSAVTSQDTANRILSKALEGNNMAYSVVDIALRLGMKEFIYHRYVQTLVDLVWRGAECEPTTVAGQVREPLPENFSFLILAVRAIVPGLNFAFDYRSKARGVRQVADAWKEDDSHTDDKNSVLFESMARTLKISRSESHASRTHLLSESDDGDQGALRTSAIRNAAQDLASRFQSL